VEPISPPARLYRQEQGVRVMVVNDSRGIVDSKATDQSSGFADAVALHSARLMRLAYLLTGDAGQAEDVVAEAYARVWPKYKDRLVEDLGLYLRRAVVNVARGGFRRKLLERRSAMDPHSEWDHRGLDEQVVDRAELWPAMLRLPLNQRAVLVLRFVEDLSEQETARLLGVSAGTVKSRTARGLEQLRRTLHQGRADGRA
jgi:RNA polymerase sigma-70 factor (sigma-E family)